MIKREKWLKDQKERSKKFRDNNKAKLLEKKTKYVDYTRKLISRWKVIKGCDECGYNKCSYNLHLAHIDKSTKRKQNTSNTAINPGWSINTIKTELNKCRVLCANCHGEETVIKGDCHINTSRIRWRK